MQKKNRSALKKIIILIVLFASFIAFLIISGRQQTPAPEETMTTASVIAAGIIKNGGLEIDVSAVEDDLRQGELYSLADTIKRYLAEKNGEDISGNIEIISCSTKETSDEKNMTVFFRFGKTMYEAKKDLTKSTSEFAVTEHSNGKK